MAGATSLRKNIYDEDYYTENFIKLETCSSADLDSTSDCMETEDNNGFFCEELNSTGSKSLISPENLDVVDLDKIDQQVSHKRHCNGFGNVALNNNNVVLQVKSLKALNSVAESDITFNPLLKTTRVNEPVRNTLHERDTYQDVEYVNVAGVIKQIITETKSQVPTTPSSSNSPEDTTTPETNSTVAEHLSGNTHNIFIYLLSYFY